MEMTEIVPAKWASPTVSLTNWIHARRWFLLMVLLPTLLAAVYYGLIASDIYVSESRFTIKATEQKNQQVVGLASLVQSAGMSAGQAEANEVIDYIRSRDALVSLSRKMPVKDAFRNTNVDRLSRYPMLLEHDSAESLFKFYNDMVSASLDSQTGIVVLSVKAFTPRDAYAINQNILLLSERLVNDLSKRAQQKAIQEALDRVNKAEQRVLAARLALRSFRNSEQLIDPERQAEGTLKISNELVTQRAALQIAYDRTRQAAPRNPSLPAMAGQLAELDRQIARQNAEAYGSDQAISSKLVGFEGRIVEQELATAMLKSANTSLEQARVDAQKQQFYLQRIVNPGQPDEPLLPKRLYRIMVVFGAAVCLYFIGWMLIVGILEHSPEN